MAPGKAVASCSATWSVVTVPDDDQSRVFVVLLDWPTFLDVGCSPADVAVDVKCCPRRRNMVYSD